MDKKLLDKNQQITLDITGFSAEGSGVGHFEGMAVFVPGAAAGDKLLVHIIMAKKNYAIGKIVKIIKSAKIRCESDCTAFPRCGGCVFRHIKYSAELELKQQRVKDAFQRIGHLCIEPQLILSLEGTKIDRYRNKAQYPVRKESANVSIGFFAEKSHRVIDCKSCKLQPSEFEKILEAFSEWIREKFISVYNEDTKEGLLRHIYLRKAFATGEIMVCAVINSQKLPFADLLISKLIKAEPGIKSIAININTEDTNVILGNKCSIIWGSDYIEDILCDIKVRLSPLSFYQVNHDGAEMLYSKAAQYAALTGKETVLDLYCGAGTIGLTMAKNAKKVIGVEIISEAVRDAVTNAEINNIKNAEFLCMDAEKAALKLQSEKTNCDVVVVDPPRKGCDRELLNVIAEIAPSRIVYVSCDPATLARDCEILTEKGYEIKEATPVDMFPRTAHVETVVLLSHKVR